MSGKVLDIFRSDRTSDLRFRAEGLAPVMCYDPWFSRALETIRQSIRDGNPVLIRLHTGAMYPINSNIRYRADLESHAVMVFGYDDEAQVLFLKDPWDLSKGGEYGRSWCIGYDDLLVLNVDASLGITTNLAPLQVQAEANRDSDGNLILNIKAGFYVPIGAVVDHGTFTITEVTFTCEAQSSMERQNVQTSTIGHWPVGDCAVVSVPFGAIGKKDCEVTISAKAAICGYRPYDFVDHVTSTVELAIPAQSGQVKIAQAASTG